MRYCLCSYLYPPYPLKESKSKMNTTNREPTRVLVMVKPSSRHWSNKDNAVMNAALHLISKELIPEQEALDWKDCKFMAKEMWGIITFFIFDIFHNDYDSSTAHLEGKNDLPVITVRFSKKKESAGFEAPSIQAQANQQLRQIHDNEGTKSEAPFYVDHTNGQVPTYWNPRTVVSMSSDVPV